MKHRTVPIIIVSRPGADANVARAVGLNITASSTSSARTAAERVAIKVKTGVRGSVEWQDPKAHGITIKEVSPTWYQASWEDPQP